MDTAAMDVEARARLIAARAERLLYDEEADWTDYCLPGCALCAIELAREQIDEERGWMAVESDRTQGDAAIRRARALVVGTSIQDRVVDHPASLPR